MKILNSAHLLFFKNFLGLVFIISFLSCAYTAGTVVKSYPSEKVIENSFMVANRLQVVDIRKDMVNGLLRAQITAENTTFNDFQFEYRFRWLDLNGFEVRTPLSTWNSIYSTAKDTINMSAVAPDKNIKDFIFIVRFPDRW